MWKIFSLVIGNFILLLWQLEKSHALQQHKSFFMDLLENMEFAETVESYSTDMKPKVQTTSGLIYGSKDQYANCFFSIPYAVPPVGDLRFRPPKMLNTTNIHRNLSQKINIACVQEQSKNSVGFQFKEDCLVLSVFVPPSVNLSTSISSSHTPLPVMLFIHGGAFKDGSGNLPFYDGRYLSNATKSIVVTINYRLGPFGFLVFDDGEHKFEGNQGLKDQQLAMRWVKENIKNFGGDPQKVTLFGESAGAQSTTFHLLSNVSAPLFHHAIVESNPVAYRYPNRQEALNRSGLLVHELRCWLFRWKDCCELLTKPYDCLMKSSAKAVLRSVKWIADESIAKSLFDPASQLFEAEEPFRPYIDGIEFTDQPLALFKQGKWNTDKPFIIGTNKEELYVPRYLKYLLIHSGSSFRERVTWGFSKMPNGHAAAEKIIATYLNLYGHKSYDDEYLFSMVLTDYVFGCTTRALARLASDTTASNVYYYIFNYALSGPDCEKFFKGSFFTCGHATHGEEVFFVFRTIQPLGMTPTPNDTLVENQFSTYWGNMAWKGNPSGGVHLHLKGTFPKWVPYSQSNSSANSQWTNLQITAPHSKLEQNHLEKVCDMWDSFDFYPSPNIKT